MVGARFTVAVGPDFQKIGKGVDRLDAYAVEAHGFLEGVAVVLGSGVDFCGAVQQFSQGNAAAEVAHRDDVVLDRDVDLAPGAHDELIDRVIDDLLDQHVDAVVGLRAVAQFADIHARTQADVLAPVEGLDVVLDIFHGLFGALIEIEGRFVGDIFGIGVGIFVHFARCFTEIGVLNLPDRICLPQIYKKIRSKGNSEV